MVPNDKAYVEDVLLVAADWSETSPIRLDQTLEACFAASRCMTEAATNIVLE